MGLQVRDHFLSKSKNRVEDRFNWEESGYPCEQRPMPGSDWDQSYGKGQVKAEVRAKAGEGGKIRVGW